jgi:hypothetical protein
MRRAQSVGAGAVAAAIALAACGGSSTSTNAATTSATAAPTPSPTPSPTAAPPSAADAYPVVSSYAGHYSGSWNDATFGTTGSMTWDIAADPATRHVTITVNAGGRFFGGNGAPPEHILLTHLGEGVVSGTSAAFGTVSGTIRTDGTFTMTLTNVPGGSIARVDITGAFTGGSTIAMRYTVSFNGSSGTATGTVSLERA